MVTSNKLLVLSGQQVASLLQGREREITCAVSQAYTLHALGQSSLPHSLRLGFPDNPLDRIMALPAYLGDGFDLAGVKWIASMPANVSQGRERAHALMVLNARATGEPIAVLEASIISARRTAASAALAAELILGPTTPAAVGFVGCGLINFEVSRFLMSHWPDISTALVFDVQPDRAEQFAEKLRQAQPDIEVRLCRGLDELLPACPLISFATTVVEPNIHDLSACQPGATLLHVSLRDLTPEVILASRNVVDDIEHVCQGRTSVHLAAEAEGSTDFIEGTLGDLLTQRLTIDGHDARPLIFSPFGLGVLDLAVAKLVLDQARATGVGSEIDSFTPLPWTQRD